MAGSKPISTRSPGRLALVVGIVALEFAAALSSFVASTLLPTVARDLDARGQLGLLVAGSTLGLFVAMPLATRVVRRLGNGGTLTVGVVGYLGGAAMAATSPAAPGFRGWPVRRGTRRRTARRVRDQRSHPTSGRCSASAGDCGFVSDVDLARAGGSGCHPGARARARVAVDSSGAGTGGPRRPVLGGTRRACGPPRRAISPSSTLADTAGADRGERPGADQRARIVVADRSRRRRRLLSRCRDDPAGRHCPAAAGRTGCSGCDAAVRDRIFRCRQPDHRAADRMAIGRPLRGQRSCSVLRRSAGG